MVVKRLTYVFEGDLPLPNLRRWKLADGIFLASVPKYLLEQDENYNMQSILPRFSEFFDDHLHETTLNIEYQGHQDLNYEGGRSQEPKAFRKLDNYLLTASVQSPEFGSPYAAFVAIPSTEHICRSSRMRDYAPLEDDLVLRLSRSTFRSIDRLYPVVTQALQGSTGRLPTALTYYNQAFRRDIALPVRFLGLMMGIEALFSHDAREISHQVSERIAFFLSRHEDKRLRLYESMKKWYGIRSLVAHGGALNPQRNYSTEFSALLRTLRAALLRILNNHALITLFTTARGNAFGDAMKKLLFFGRPL